MNSSSSSRVLFAATLIGLGITGLVNGDFALGWQRIPLHSLPGKTFIAYLCALIELGGGVGLLFKPGLRLSARILFPYLTLWAVLLKLPLVVMQPLNIDTWGSLGEITLMMAGAWCLFADHPGTWEQAHLGSLVGARGIRAARILLIVSLPMIGLVHFIDIENVASFVPGWLPFHLGWAYLTGTGSLAAAIALTFGIVPRLAATLEAFMLGCITVFTWGALLDTGRTAITAFLISAALTAGTWVVAETYRDVPWLGRGRPVWKI